MSKNKSMIMTADSVATSIEGRKTHTRRVVEPQPPKCYTISSFDADSKDLPTARFECYQEGDGHWWAHTVKPRYQPGDIVYAKEWWRVGYWEPKTGEIGICYKDSPICKTFYKPDEQVFNKLFIASTEDAMAAGFVSNDDGYFSWGDDQCPTRWRNPRFMYKWASRLWLEITGVRAERLQEIAYQDCIAEGMPNTGDWQDPVFKTCGVKRIEWVGQDGKRRADVGAKAEFIEAWNTINAHRGYSWGSNPYVWVYQYKVVDRPEAV